MINHPNYKPLYSRIVVEMIKEEKTSGGIIYQEKEPDVRKGKVLSCGPGTQSKTGVLIPMELKVGDVVVFPGHVYEQKDRQEIDGKTYLMMNEDDVLGVLE